MATAKRLNACCECGGPITSVRHDAAFCTPKCRKAYNNRRMQRGAELIELYWHTRFNRQEAIEFGIRTIMDNMVSTWNEEDKAAGRRHAAPLKELMQRNIRYIAVRSNAR